MTDVARRVDRGYVDRVRLVCGVQAGSIGRKEAMTKGQAIADLERLGASDDPEESHAEADDVLCSLLESLGHDVAVTAYYRLTRWFA